MTTAAHTTPARPPVPVAILSGVQFAAAAAVVVVFLGNETTDGDLTVGEIIPAVLIALAGAALVGATWSGVRPFWFIEQPMAIAAGAWAAINALDGSSLWWGVVAASVLWIVTLWIPTSRRWFSSPN